MEQGKHLDPHEVADTIAAVVRSIYAEPGPVMLHRPFLSRKDMARAIAVVADDPVNTHVISCFEEELADACGVAHAVATSSGTAALHLAMLAVGVQQGTRVSMPPNSFMAAHNAARYCGATVEYSNGPTAPVHVAAHIFGAPDPWLQDIARGALPYPKDLTLIEDAAEALGSRLYGKPLGSWGDVGIISFNNNKIVTTMGGGAVVTNSAEIARKVRHLGSTARKPGEGFDYDAVGFNYRMGTVNAAIGLQQLRRLPAILEFKRSLARYYMFEFKMDGFMHALPMDGVRSNEWLNGVLLPATMRSAVMQRLRDSQINARSAFVPLPDVKPAIGVADPGALAAARRFHEQAILLPSGWNGDTLK